eukprot:m.65321 g.65321  ORF g.65321 m.65321 type:complete len:607 (+) comp11725_c0_seq1:138-1958(+)
MATPLYRQDANGDFVIYEPPVKKCFDHRNFFATKTEFSILTSKAGFLLLLSGTFAFFILAMVSGIVLHKDVSSPNATHIKQQLNNGSLNPVFYISADFLIITTLIVFGVGMDNIWVIRFTFLWYRCVFLVIPVLYGIFMFERSHCANILWPQGNHTKHNARTEYLAQSQCSTQFILLIFLSVFALIRAFGIFSQRVEMLITAPILSLIILLHGVYSLYSHQLQMAICDKMGKYDTLVYKCSEKYRHLGRIEIWVFLVIGTVSLLLSMAFIAYGKNRQQMARKLVNEDYEKYKKAWKRLKINRQEFDQTVKRIQEEFALLLGYKKSKKKHSLRHRTFPWFKGIVQDVSNLDLLLEDARAVNPWFQNKLKEWFDKLQKEIKNDWREGDTENEFKECGIKGKQRAEEKAKRSYRGRYEMLLDLVRGSLVCEFRHVPLLLRIIGDDNRVQVLRGTNRFKEGARETGGYRDLQLKIRLIGWQEKNRVDESLHRGSDDKYALLLSNHIAEVQIHIPSINEIKKGFEKNEEIDFEQSRTLYTETSNGFKALTEQLIREDVVLNDMLSKNVTKVQAVYSWFRNVRPEKRKEILKELRELSGHDKYKIHRYLLDN